MGEKLEYNGTITLLVIDFKIAYELFRREYSHLV
jgi:hypothetical protein